MAESVPEQASYSKASLGGDHGSACLGVFRTWADADEIFRLERVDSIGIRFEIVEQADYRQLKLSREFFGVNRPREVRNLAAPIAHGASNAETGAEDRDALGACELRKDFGEAAVFLA